MPKYEAGDFVKVEFADEATGVSEWMWVRVQSCDDSKELVFGVLDSVPLNSHGNGVKLGSELAVSYERVRDHRKHSDFAESV